MLNNKNLKLISIIKTYINNDPKLHIKSYYYNRKYTIDELLPYMCNIIYERYLLAKMYLKERSFILMNGTHLNSIIVFHDI